MNPAVKTSRKVRIRISIKFLSKKLPPDLMLYGAYCRMAIYSAAKAHAIERNRTLFILDLNQK